MDVTLPSPAEQLAQANARTEEAWLAYNKEAQAMPDCEHVRGWRVRMRAARRAHLEALHAAERLAARLDKTPPAGA
jgi:hypothetical protein